MFWMLAAEKKSNHISTHASAENPSAKFTRSQTKEVIKYPSLYVD
jgi:hypothetical protein